jgi:hypothetical protein
MLDQGIEFGKQVGHACAPQPINFARRRPGDRSTGRYVSNLGLLVHADDDVERVFERDLGDEIHHRQAVKFQIPGKGAGIG